MIVVCMITLVAQVKCFEKDQRSKVIELAFSFKNQIFLSAIYHNEFYHASNSFYLKSDMWQVPCWLFHTHTKFVKWKLKVHEKT